MGLDDCAEERQEFARVPIVAITAYGNWAAAKAIEAGANLTMLKPIEPDEMIENIRRLI